METEMKAKKKVKNSMKVDLGQNLSFTISDAWRQLKSMPEDPPGSKVFAMETENCQGFFMAFPTKGEQTMPFDNPQAVIDGIHDALTDNQALIEVKSDSIGKSRIIYSIVKSRKESSGVQYTLTMDIGTDHGAVRLQGFFDEVGATGVRDAVVYEMKRRNGAVDINFEGWMADPYDNDFQKPYLMNLSEHKEFDSMFPQHPLSIARAFAAKIIAV